MKALVYTAPRRLEMLELADPILMAGEVVANQAGLLGIAPGTAVAVYPIISCGT